jgi:hypothetical protein
VRGSRFDIIIIETVGVGQSETAVHSMVDFFLLIQIAVPVMNCKALNEVLWKWLMDCHK